MTNPARRVKGCPRGLGMADDSGMLLRGWALALGSVLMGQGAQGAPEPAGAPRGLTLDAEARARGALEAAFAETGRPELLLALAAALEVDAKRCPEALEVYRRFFEACADCAALSYGVDRFDLAIVRCVEDPEREATLRETYRVKANLPKPTSPSDATRAEVAELLRRAKSIDRAEVGRAMVTFVELGPNIHQTELNALRARAWGILVRVDATAEQVMKLLQRIEKVDREAYVGLLGRLMFAAKEENKDELNAVRQAALARLGELEQADAGAPAAYLGCRPNAKREWGFLTVNTVPWSEISVNGRSEGTTPLSNVRALAGCAVLRVKNPATGEELVRNVTVEPNKTTILMMNLEKGVERRTVD